MEGVSEIEVVIFVRQVRTETETTSMIFFINQLISNQICIETS